YGPAWFDFIGSCRSMLGSESGSNVFDFDGSLEREFERTKALKGGVPPSYQEFAPLIADREEAISMGQLSPRIFECAAMRTPMIQFRAAYSNAIEPDAHYFALEKDFSNLDDILARLEDTDAL